MERTTRLGILFPDYPWQLWFSLGIFDIKRRYQRSVVGPWWISLSFATLLLSMGMIFGKVFQQPMSEYLPSLGAGLLFWNFVSISINESVTVFSECSNYIRQGMLAYSIFISRLVTRNLIIFLHNFIVIFGIIIYFGGAAQIRPFAFLIGLVIVTLNIYWMSALVAIVGTRFRDIGQIAVNILQVTFFITPITWLPRLVSEGSLILALNPFAYLLTLLRMPLLGNMPPLNAWLVSLGMLVLGSTITLWSYAARRSRIPFWV